MMRARARVFAMGAGIACALVLAYSGVRLWPRIEERRLLSRLDEGSEKECAEAIEALLARGPGVFPAIIECLETGSSRRRLWCLHAVEEARIQDLLPRDLLEEVGEAMIRCGFDADEDVQERLVQVADVISLTGRPSFRGLLESPDENVRITAYTILAEGVDHSEEPPRDIEPLLPIVLEGLKDPNMAVRFAAASILGRCDWMASTVVPALMDAYAREASRNLAPDGEIPALFISALSRLGPLARPAVPVLILVIKTEPNEEEVLAAIDALTAIRFIGKEGIAALEKAASTGEPEIGSRAESALEEVSAEEEEEER